MSWFPAKSWESKFLILKLWKPWNFPDPEALICALGRKLWLDESFKWTFSSPIFYHKNSQNQKESSAFRFKRFRFWSSERLEKFWSFEPKRLLKILKFFQDLKICRFFCRCKTSSALDGSLPSMWIYAIGQTEFRSFCESFSSLWLSLPLSLWLSSSLVVRWFAFASPTHMIHSHNLAETYPPNRTRLI